MHPALSGSPFSTTAEVLACAALAICQAGPAITSGTRIAHSLGRAFIGCLTDRHPGDRGKNQSYTLCTVHCVKTGVQARLGEPELDASLGTHTTLLPKPGVPP